MKRNVMIMALLPAALALAAQDQTKSREGQEKENLSMLAALGLPLPGSGIHLISSQAMKGPKEIQSKNSRMFFEQKKNGYVKEETPRAQQLLEFRNTAPYQYKKYEENHEPWSTHLRHSIADLKMAYTFIGAPVNEMTPFIGVAPIGVYREEGWSGAVQFFNNEAAGSCAFTENNVKVSHAAVELIEQAITYDINGKPTLTLIKGTNTTGYLYDIQWFDPIFFRQLECANKEYSADRTQKIMDLAKRIDSNNNL